MSKRPRFGVLVLLALWGGCPAAANELETELGRNEVRVYSAPLTPAVGTTVWNLALADRLDRMGYRRVRQRPQAPGQYFWGQEIFWIHRRAFRHQGRTQDDRLFGLRLNDQGSILGAVDETGAPRTLDDVHLEPEVLAESLDGHRARRRRFDLEAVPEHVWRPVLAAEDSRFFDHIGLDGRSLARALLANVRAGKVTQGGSTITQQLIKNRDLSPRRSLGRKASEAVRALGLEANYGKETILEAYLNQVYLGHVDGLAVHGFATAAKVFFSKPVAELDLAESALLAAIIQGPNRLSPQRHPEAARKRRDWVLSRMAELEWATAKEVDAAKRRTIRLRTSSTEQPLGGHLLSWISEIARKEAPRRLAKGRGVVVETSLDPQMQEVAEEALAAHLADLRRKRNLRKAPISAALVTLDAETGDVLAYVGGDPAAPPGGFDRARKARRQPGSAIKPLLLLEAFENCGRREPLHPASRLADEPLELNLPSGAWAPVNSDKKFRGVVDVREALRDSLNVPFVRLVRWCGFDATARRLNRTGLDLPIPPPPAFALGAVEISPLELAQAYTALAGRGTMARARPILRLERPGGRRLERFRTRPRRLSSQATAWLVENLMQGAVNEGTAQGAQLEELEPAAKTGTSSDRRDAWLAGFVGDLVTVVWVGRDDGAPLGLTGAQAAAPLWQRYMDRAARMRPRSREATPSSIVSKYVDPRTGLLVRSFNSRARSEYFRRGALPPRDRFWRTDSPVPVIQ